MPLFIRFLVGIIFTGIPILLLAKGVLNTVKDSPIPEELNTNEYLRKHFIALSVLIFGIFFLVVCAVLPVYLTGGTINIGNYVIQRE